MALWMSLLAIASFMCFALASSHAFVTGWVPAVTMTASMIGTALAPAATVRATVLLVAVPGLLLSAILVGRGPDKPMAVHRGLSAVAMALLSIKALAASGPRLAEAPSGHGAHHTSQPIDLLIVVLVAGAVWFALAFAFRGARSVRSATPAFPADRVASRVGGAGRALLSDRTSRRLQRGEAVLMAAALVVMAVHP